jgi:hypothetical protein
MAHLALDWASALGFIVLELATKIGHFAPVQCIDREVVATVAIISDFILAQYFRHGFPPIYLFFVARRAAELDQKVTPAFGSVKKRR